MAIRESVSEFNRAMTDLMKEKKEAEKQQKEIDEAYFDQKVKQLEE